MERQKVVEVGLCENLKQVLPRPSSDQRVVDDVRGIVPVYEESVAERRQVDQNGRGEHAEVG